MLVNSFDTKYSLTAKKYESLDNLFTKTVSANKKFSRIFTSVIEDKSLKSLSDATLRSDITGQVINTILTHDSKSKHFLYYMGDVFKKDKMTSKRVILEYNKSSTISVRYQEKQERIVFDHLIPMRKDLEGLYEYYVPDGTYDSMTYSNGKWLFRSDVTVNNANTNATPKIGRPKMGITPE